MATLCVREALALTIVGGLLAIAASESPTAQLTPTPIKRRAVTKIPRETIFKTQELVPTFETLESRGCLPVNFNHSDTIPLAEACLKQLDSGCDDIPPVAVFYTCMAESMSLMMGNGSFDVEAFEDRYDWHTTDESWREKAWRMSAVCKRASDAFLTPRQEAVYMFTCLKWSLFLDCDRQQEEQQQQEEATPVAFDDASLRRARFLSGPCPLSPRLLLDAFGLVTGRTWAECVDSPMPPAASAATNSESQQRYAFEVSRISCLLQDFTNATTGHIDIDNLSTAIKNSGEDQAPNDALLHIVAQCCGRHASHQMSNGHHNAASHQMGEGHHNAAYYHKSEGHHNSASHPMSEGHHNAASHHKSEGHHNAASHHKSEGHHNAASHPMSEGHHNAHVTVDEFVNCWARTGIFSCAHKEANDVAHRFHQDCLQD